MIFFRFVLSLKEIFNLLEQFGSENEVVKALAFTLEYCLVIANPVAMAFIDEHNILADTEHGIHIVGIDNGCHIVFMRNIT